MRTKLIRLGALLIAILMLVAVVGCSGTGNNNKVNINAGGGEADGDTPDQIRIQEQIKTLGEDITVLVAGSVESLGCQMEGQRYEQLTGGKKVTYVSSNGYSEMQMKLVSLHMSDEAPDVYDFTNQDYPSLLYKGILSPLDDILDLNDVIFTEEKPYIEALRWDGKCYFVPRIGTDRDLWVNKQILVDAGIPESEWPNNQYKAGTWTWDAFVDIVKRVSDPEKGVYGTMYDTNVHSAWPASAGVDFIKLTDTGFVGNAKDENVTRAMTVYKEIYTNPNYVPVKSGESAMEMFKRGKICMWYYMRVATQDEIIGEQYANGDVFFTAFPRDPKLDVHYRMGDIAGRAIPLSAKHKNGAAAYLLAPFASDYYQDQIDAIDMENYNWDEELVTYIEEDLLKRPAVACFSLGFKELQATIGKACFTTIFEEDWSTIANTFDPEAQHIIDTQQ